MTAVVCVEHTFTRNRKSNHNCGGAVKMCADTGQAPREANEESRENDTGAYQVLMSLYTHQDQLYWSTVQLLIATQGALHAAAYITRQSCVGPSILFFGAIPSLILLSLLARKYRVDRDLNLNLLDMLVKRIYPRPLLDIIYQRDRETQIRLLSAPKRCSRLIVPGRLLICLVVFLALLSDLLFLCLYLCKPCLFPNPCA